MFLMTKFEIIHFLSHLSHCILWVLRKYLYEPIITSFFQFYTLGSQIQKTLSLTMIRRAVRGYESRAWFSKTAVLSELFYLYKIVLFLLNEQFNLLSKTNNSSSGVSFLVEEICFSHSNSIDNIWRCSLKSPKNSCHFFDYLNFICFLVNEIS